MSFKAVFLNFKDKICSFYKKDKKIFISICVCLIIFFALIISTFVDINKNKKVVSTKKIETTISVSDYATNIENKLESLLSKLDSIKTVSVMVMVESSPQVTYLTESTTKTETKENNSVSEISTIVVIEKNGSISTPVVVTTINPKITGVLIVTNKINATTKLAIINSVSNVLNISESCISLLQEK